MLRPLAPNLWIAEHPQTLFGVRIGARMTVIRLDDGSLWLHSAIPLDAALKAELEALGPVRHVVAPNQFHHLYGAAAVAAFPGATLYTAPGLRQKVKDLPEGPELSDTPPDAWRRQIDQVVFGGMPKVNEVVFFHRASKTLIVTDLIFHMKDVGHWWSRTFLTLNKAYDRFGMSSFFRSNIKEPAAARASADRILTFDFDRVIMSHGVVLETGGRPAVAEALASVG